jgi:pimeloyl-ACP methyl ester carboxylesterase
VDTLHGCAASAPSFLLDVPGFGAGAQPCSPELGAMADVVAEWLKVVLDQPAVLFGHSTAAQVAMTVAARRPELVGALVLAGPTFPPPLRRLGRPSVALLRDLVHESPAALPGTVPSTCERDRDDCCGSSNPLSGTNPNG